MAQRSNAFRRRLISQHEDDRVAWNQMNHQEHHAGDDSKDGYRGEQSPQQILGHREGPSADVRRRIHPARGGSPLLATARSSSMKARRADRFSPAGPAPHGGGPEYRRDRKRQPACAETPVSPLAEVVQRISTAA